MGHAPTLPQTPNRSPPSAGSGADTPIHPECPMQISPPPRRSLIGEALALAMAVAPLAALIAWAG